MKKDRILGMRIKSKQVKEDQIFDSTEVLVDQD